MGLSGQEIRDASRLARQRKRPTYDTITEEEAKRKGYRPVTSPYAIRQFQQCEMLDSVIRDFKDCDVKLVRNSNGNLISLWRRQSEPSS